MVRDLLKLSLEEYSTWLDREIDKLVRPAISKGRKLLDDAQGTLRDAERFFEDLSRKGDRDMGTKKDPVSYRAARVIGRSAKDAYETLAKLQVPVEVSWESLKAFRDSLSLASRAVRDTRNRTGPELSGLYLLDMRSFGGHVDRVSRSSEKLTQFLEGDGISLQKARTLESILSSVQASTKELSDRELERQTLLESSRHLSDEIEKLEVELSELSNRGPLREVLEIEKTLRVESREFRTVSLAHLQRPLRKLRDLSQRGEVPLSLDERAALDKVIASPFRSFVSRKTGPFVAGILRSVKTALESGKMGFKPRKAARVNGQLDHLLHGDDLSAKQSRGRELLSRRWTLLRDVECKKLYSSRKTLLQRLEEARQQREEVLGRVRSLNEMSVALGVRVNELLATAEARTGEYTGQKIQIERSAAAAGE